MTALYFDTIAYLQDARDAGITQKAAEVQAKYMKLAINEATQAAHEELLQRDLATKQDLQITEQKLEMAEQKLESKLDLKTEQLRKEIEQVRREIEQSKNSFMIWLFSLLTGYSGIIVGVIGKGFHWW